MTRGRLRVYLGAAAGVGKTYAMLAEGHRRVERGTDVVIGFVEDHGRPMTHAMIGDLEIVPRRSLSHRGSTFEEMDVDAILQRLPRVVLVDELAHTNVPGSRNEKRCEDVEELLTAGIDVVTTVNIQHLESLNDVVADITGVAQRETIPDAVVRRAEQVELVDQTPEALRRRMAHGNVYPAERIDAALANYFRAGNLSALRELALLWLADKVEDALRQYRRDHDIDATWATRERVVVALTGGPESETLVRRGARIASRGAGGELMALYIARSDGLSGASSGALAGLRQLVEDLGGTLHSVVGEDVPRAILDFARGTNATQVVIGVSRRGRLARLFAGSGVGSTVVDQSGDIDVHMVTHDYAGAGAGGPTKPVLGRRRRIAGWLTAVVGPALLAVGLDRTRDLHQLSTELMLFLTLTVGVALIGGVWPAVVAAALGSLLVNYFFTPPLRTFTVAQPENLLALVVFVVVGVAVASVVDRAARQAQRAARARAEADTLGLLAGSVLRGERALPALLERLRETFGMTSVTLAERVGEHGGWLPVATASASPAARPNLGEDTGAPQDPDWADRADVLVDVSPTLRLLLDGRVPPAEDRRVLEAFAAQAAVALDRERLAGQAAEAGELAEGNALRTALLAAVSHDLRTPLASIKAAVTTLRQDDLVLSPDEVAELLATAEDASDRLDALVTNLLDMSRLQTASVRPLVVEIPIEEVLPRSLPPSDPARATIVIEVADGLPLVLADAGLLERALANVIENAVRHAPPSSTVRVTASSVDRRVEVRVVDVGPGVPEDAKATMFLPFQRLGDSPRGSGTGLGLAVARGFVEAMGGELFAEDTPGGGLTMVCSLPASQVEPTVVPEAVSRHPTAAGDHEVRA